MDPATSGSSCKARRFPRTRGDGPWSGRHDGCDGWFPPHARGWTVHVRDDRLLGVVSPARAGMDPVRVQDAREAEGFPRTRGDGPLTFTVRGRNALFPPHARGWTASSPLPPSQATVSPARAGMDPSYSSCGRGFIGFPRTRGDGPSRATTRNPALEFPPHARGWTHYPLEWAN